MNKKKSKKIKLLGQYFVWWFVALVFGGLAWLLFYGFWLHPLAGIEMKTSGFFSMGFLSGICAAMCYSLVWQLMTPIVKWVKGKVRHQPKGFLELWKAEIK